jgi:hypothetical protein
MQSWSFVQDIFSDIPEAAMSLILTIVMMTSAWVTVASAALWGVLRISRRHPAHRTPDRTKPEPASQAPAPVNPGA